VEVVASLSQGRTAAVQCGLFTYKSVPVIFEPPCIMQVLLCLFVSFYRSFAMHLIDILSVILKAEPFYCPGLDESKRDMVCQNLKFWLRKLAGLKNFNKLLGNGACELFNNAVGKIT